MPDIWYPNCPIEFTLDIPLIKTPTSALLSLLVTLRIYAFMLMYALWALCMTYDNAQSVSREAPVLQDPMTL